MKYAKHTVIWLAITMSLLIAVSSYRFLFVDDMHMAFGPDLWGHIDYNRLFFMLHIVAAPIALAVGPFQFMPWLRNRFRTLHKLSGYLYAAVIVVGGIGAFGMAFTVSTSVWSTVAYILLSTLWVSTTVYAVYHAAVTKKLTLHREWMMRSYALTLAGLMFRLILLILFAFGLTYTQAAEIAAWLSWVPNLIVAEYLIRRKGKTQ